MENKKDIGKAISDKLNSLDKTPREQVWSGINYELQKKKKRRIGFFFFWGKIIGLVLIGAIAGLYIYHQNGGFNWGSTDNSKDTITINNVNGETITVSPNTKNLKNNSTETKTNSSIAFGNKNTTESNTSINNKNNSHNKSGNSLENTAYSKSKNASATATRKGKINTIYSKSAKNKSALFSKAGIKKSKNNSTKKSRKKFKKGKTVSNSSETKTTKSDAALIDLNGLQNKDTGDLRSEVKVKKTDSIAKKDKEKTITIKMYPKDSLKKDSTIIYKKIAVDAFVSPTLYGYFAKGSSLDRRLDSLSKKSEIRFSYGFGLTYDLTEKISIRIGYSKIGISYVTKNAPIDTDNYRGIAYNPNISNETILIASQATDIAIGTNNRMDITQKISYTEIPLEVKYQFLDKKFRLKSSFGFSYLLLDENKVSVKTDTGFSQDIGKTKDLSGTSVSVNLGLEMDYPLFKDTKLFVEPMFNYQIKAFSNNDFKPYVFGIHTGIRYTFNNK